MSPVNIVEGSGSQDAPAPVQVNYTLTSNQYLLLDHLLQLLKDTNAVGDSLTLLAEFVEYATHKGFDNTEVQKKTLVILDITICLNSISRDFKKAA